MILGARRPALDTPTDPRHAATARHRVRRPVLLLLLAMTVVWALAPATASAASSAVVRFAPLPSVTIGEEFTVDATIRTSGGVSPILVPAILYMGNVAVARAHADATGRLAFRVSRNYTRAAGTFPLRIVSSKTHDVAAAANVTKLTIKPAMVTVATVPIVRGIPVTLGAASGKTGDDGTVTFPVSRVGVTDLTAHIDKLDDPAIRVSFVRWGDSVYDQSRSINVTGGGRPITLFLGLRTAFKGSVNFVDETGQAIDPTQISRARFTSSTGQELVLTDFSQPAWWEAGSAVSRTGGLQASATLWRLAEVQMAGTNVVNQGQQSFTPAIDAKWTINVLLFDLVVHTNDALTGGAIAGTAELQFPDSTTRVATIGNDGNAEFHGLPRGTYTVRLKINGIAPPTPIALSKTQGATIRVISAFDIGLAVILALLVLFVLLWIGRRRHLGWIMRLSAVPAGAARRIPVRKAPAAARSTVPAAKSTVQATMSDFATVTNGPRSEAVGFGRYVVASVAAAFARLGQRLFGSRGTSDAERGASARGGKPSWPTPAAETSTMQPPVTASGPAIRPTYSAPAATTTSRWYAPIEETTDEPSHPCPVCNRPVPDTATFCRSCGHRQD